MGLGFIDSNTVTKLEAEIMEMLVVLKWLDKRISQEGNEKCRDNLIATREYVRSSIDCFKSDILNLGK